MGDEGERGEQGERGERCGGSCTGRVARVRLRVDDGGALGVRLARPEGARVSQGSACGVEWGQARVSMRQHASACGQRARCVEQAHVANGRRARHARQESDRAVCASTWGAHRRVQGGGWRTTRPTSALAHSALGQAHTGARTRPSQRARGGTHVWHCSRVAVVLKGSGSTVDAPLPPPVTTPPGFQRVAQADAGRFTAPTPTHGCAPRSHQNHS